ncbi:MAG: VanW family protein [Eubacteriales bacterium]|nr:VanW family protein [Eubacteriales bacterium]
MKKRKIIICSLVALTVLSCGGYLGWCYKLQDDVIWTDYVVNGVAIKNLTTEEAEKAIQNKFVEDYQDCQYTVTIAQKEYNLDVFPALSIDASDIVADAYLAGHREWYKRGLDYYRNSKIDKSIEVEVTPEVSDSESVMNQLKDTDIAEINTVEESVCTLEEDRLSIHKGHDGICADYDALIASIESYLEQGELNKEFACPTKNVKMKSVDLEPYYRKIHKLKVNAVLDPVDPTQVLPSEFGVSFDLDSAAESYEKAAEDSDIEIIFEYDTPDMTTEELKSLIFRDELSHIEVKGAGSSNRMANITLACSFCNEKILAPGEVFSYNDTVGERTAERGFKVAGVYSSGTVAQGIGGGICQVSSTIYDAALYANLEIVERRNHSLTVSYVPFGMDATVNWGTQDFKFKNNTDFPVKLLLVYEDGVVKATLLGTKLDANIVEIVNESTGGLSCVTYRRIYDPNGTLINDETISNSRYSGYH